MSKKDLIKFAIADFQRQSLIVSLVLVAAVESKLPNRNPLTVKKTSEETSDYNLKFS